MTNSILGGTGFHFLETTFMAVGMRPVAPLMDRDYEALSAAFYCTLHRM